MGGEFQPGHWKTMGNLDVMALSGCQRIGIKLRLRSTGYIVRIFIWQYVLRTP